LLLVKMHGLFLCERLCCDNRHSGDVHYRMAAPPSKGC
jgi:hypothetical protein